MPSSCSGRPGSSLVDREAERAESEPGCRSPDSRPDLQKRNEPHAARHFADRGRDASTASGERTTNRWAASPSASSTSGAISCGTVSRSATRPATSLSGDGMPAEYVACFGLGAGGPRSSAPGRIGRRRPARRAIVPGLPAPRLGRGGRPAGRGAIRASAARGRRGRRARRGRSWSRRAGRGPRSVATARPRRPATARRGLRPASRAERPLLDLRELAGVLLLESLDLRQAGGRGGRAAAASPTS